MILETFTTEIHPMYGQIVLAGSGQDHMPERPRPVDDGAWVSIPAWTDPSGPNFLTLEPPSDSVGPDSVTVELFDGDYSGHPGTGAETVFVGQMEFPGPDPWLMVGSVTASWVRVPIELKVPAVYQVYVAVADRQQSILAFEGWLASEGGPGLPAIERWWVSLKFLRESGE